MLEKIFISKTRLRLLKIFLSHRTEKYYQRQLEKILNINIRSLQIELKNLLKIGFLQKEKDGNRVYYFINEKFPLLDELYKLILKGSFLIDKVKVLLSNRKADVAFIYGSASKRDLLEGSDIDLFIVGKIDPYKLHKAIKELEKDFSRVINYVIYERAEIRRKIKEREGFIMDVLNSNKIYIKGNEDEFRKIFK